MARTIRRRRRIDNHVEKQLATGMIVSTRFIKEIRPIYKASRVEVPFVKTIARWCLDYYKQYERAPEQHIQDIYNSHAREDLDETQADLIRDFLRGISSEYEHADKFNATYVLDQVEKRFKGKSLQSFSEDVQAKVSAGDTGGAEAMLGQYRPIRRPTGIGFNPLTDKEAVQSAFEQDEERLFSIPGAIGKMLNDDLVREGFLGIMGPEKRGKTFWMMELTKRALRNRCNVAYFDCGDMGKKGMTIRWHVSVAGKSNRKKYCGRFLVPVLDCARNQLDNCRKSCREGSCGLGIEKRDQPIAFKDAPKKYRPCSVCVKRKHSRFQGAIWYAVRKPVEPLTWRQGLRAGKRFMKRLKGCNLKVANFPNSKINVHGINEQLDVWEHFDGFIPDVVAVDYADILDAEPGCPPDERQKQNESWKALRALSQQRHCLVITGTQTDAASYDAFILQKKHFSEDKRKYGHVTGLMGLNQTIKDKARGLMRINWIVRREDEYIVTNTVKVLQSLEIGKPIIASYR